ncbi:TPA: GPO family capsid scaffolding protein [Yersinia enterocolitica]|nr:GPO family capsid scaffolding protein [Yersinia enterocolitica]EKN5117682.1 GPO family capsid scaffolding protein [Yersinia enterocolitica]HDM8373753.1 GPO family capsid scaffolding protein [Yersinia enterocolitica]HEN3262865.1 GPO family capsid scaffolding protein [Yersinia enterocolitica]HEN3388098.1 GPO family capsid scaffolding protein [Yersinia enterocolitica]
MTAKAKKFRIGVEGATTDGRTITREWLTQMADSYNTTVYGARINMEHIKGYSPDGTFKRYGDVTGLSAEEIKDGPLAGKMALYAEISPTDDLVAMVKGRQKVYTSMEVNTKFADTNSAYLIGLAVTDDPASLGTEMLNFSASASANPLASRKQAPENLFTAAEETLIEFEAAPEPKVNLFTTIKTLFSKKEVSDDARFNDVHQAVELVAQQVEGKFSALTALEQRFSELKTASDATNQELTELKATLSKTDRNFSQRERSTGSDSAILTDC